MKKCSNFVPSWWEVIWAGRVCLCPSSCNLKQLQNKPADPCAEQRPWGCVNPESTWLGACGQEMELLGLSALGGCDRHELLQAELSPCPCPDPGVPTVALPLSWGCVCGTLWNRLQLGVAVTQILAGLIFGEPGHCCPLCHLSACLQCSGSELRGHLGVVSAPELLWGWFRRVPELAGLGAEGQELHTWP